MLTWAPPGAVEEVEVGEDGLPVAREPDRDLPLHAVEEEGFVAAEAGGPPHLLSRPRGHEDLRLDARHLHVGGLGHRGGQDPLLDQEHVGVEPRPLVAGPNEVDDAEETDLGPVRERGQ